jgi:hypothetical protein
MLPTISLEATFKRQVFFFYATPNLQEPATVAMERYVCVLLETPFHFSPVQPFALPVMNQQDFFDIAFITASTVRLLQIFIFFLLTFSNFHAIFSLCSVLRSSLGIFGNQLTISLSLIVGFPMSMRVGTSWVPSTFTPLRLSMISSNASLPFALRLYFTANFHLIVLLECKKCCHFSLASNAAFPDSL